MNCIERIVKALRQMLDQVEGLGLRYDRQIKRTELLRDEKEQISGERERLRRRHHQQLRKLLKRLLSQSSTERPES